MAKKKKEEICCTDIVCMYVCIACMEVTEQKRIMMDDGDGNGNDRCMMQSAARSDESAVWRRDETA
jgi:hypothetical protein